MRSFVRLTWLSWGLALVFVSGEATASAQEAPFSPTPRPVPLQSEPAAPAPGLKRITLEPTPTPTPTPLVHPHLIAALESAEGNDTERIALFDDGTLALARWYRGRRTLRRKVVTSTEIEVLRRIFDPAFQAPVTWGSPEAPIADLKGRRIRIEIADASGRSRVFTTDDLTGLPLNIGRAKAALEDLRSRFFETDEKETWWEPKNVKTGDRLKHRSTGSWYLVIRDDAFEPSLEVQETGGLRNGMLLLRGQIPKLFENPETAGPPETRTPGR
jgi:hypothetical protein